MEVQQFAGAERREPSPVRMTYWNSYGPRSRQTRVGELDLPITKVRQGSCYPSFLETRHPAEQALLAQVQSAHVIGVRTRKVDLLLSALCLTRIATGNVSRPCRELDDQVAAFRNRPLEHRYRYVWLHAMYLKVGQNLRFVNRVFVVAIGVRETG